MTGIADSRKKKKKDERKRVSRKKRDIKYIILNN